MSQVISIMYGSQSFPDSNAQVVISVIDQVATAEKEKMVTRSIQRLLSHEAEWGPDFNSVQIGAREQRQVGREMKIMASRDGETDHYGMWTYRVGGIGNNVFLNVAIRSTSSGEVYSQDTLLFLNQDAPMIRLVSNFPHEDLATTNRYQIFKGRGWPLALEHLKGYTLYPKPNYVLNYVDVTDFGNDDLVLLEFDEEKYSVDDLLPQTESKRSRSGSTVVTSKVRRKRQVRRRIR